MSDIELEYLMQGFSTLSSDLKILVKNNFEKMEKGGKCPFLINKECSVYEYRPIICRVHGLAYMYKDNEVKLPQCVVEGKNFANLYKDKFFSGNPIKANLDTSHILKDMYTEIRNLYDWVKQN